MTPHDEIAADAALLARLRTFWEMTDPVPDGLAERMVTMIAIEDRSRAWSLLSLVEGRELAAVRGEAATLTLQFSDGATSVLLHVAADEEGRRRVDGWVDAPAIAIQLEQDERVWSTEPSDGGRFAFEGVIAGLTHLRMVLRSADGELHELRTPQFEV